MMTVGLALLTACGDGGDGPAGDPDVPVEQDAASDAGGDASGTDGGGVTTPDSDATPNVPDEGPDAAPDVAVPDAEEDAPDPDAADAGPDAEDVADAGPDPGTTGAPCNTPNDCYSGYCIDGPDGQVCTETCTSDCPDGWACKSIVSGGGDPDFICVPQFVGLCQPCEQHADCGSSAAGNADLCLDMGPPGRFCGADCGETGACPEGYACDEIPLPGGLVARQCVPEASECACSQKAIEQNLSTTCQVENDWGSCDGMRYCGPDGLTACDAPTPQPEQCNLLDDDCDGATDEDVAPAPCERTNGAGTCTGLSYCASGESICDAPEPDFDICDGKDNDCDGETDAGFPDSDGDGLADCIEVDDDDDGILDPYDNCPAVANPEQEDHDLDQKGDACDLDDDNDLTSDEQDCEPLDPAINAGQVEICDGKDNNCDGQTDEGYLDTDGDEIGDCVDQDDDGDGVLDGLDNCPLATNPDQLNSDGAADGGDACDPDDDDDFIPDVGDSCPKVPNFDQADLDGDGVGDVCDPDRDGDGLDNGEDNCPDVYNVGQKNTDGLDDGGDACDDDDDQDFVPDVEDNCPQVYNPDQLDSDLDGKGDACTFDKDGDGHLDDDDNCPDVSNPDQADLDGDGTGDVCDDDADGDLVPNDEDNCPMASNPNQADLDGDDEGDVCDADTDGDGHLDPVDCGPLDPDVHKGAPERCNGVDDNCGGGVDEAGAVDCTTYWYDADDDGFGRDGDTLCACGPTEGYTAEQGGDCDDTDEFVSPDGQEVCGDLVDNNCNGVQDEAGAIDCLIYYRDFDDDGYGLSDNTMCLCKPEGDFTTTEDEDCDDTAKWVHPYAVEVCNFIDDDCDGETDEDAAGGSVKLYWDGDGDGYGVDGDFVETCEAEGKYTATEAGDCADDDPALHPDAEELCNGIDDDCDGKTDETGTVGCTTYYKDADEDGYGTVFDQICACGPDVVGKYTATEKGDCADDDPTVGPDGDELCNDGVDDDCDGKTDEADALGCTPFFLDGDDDGYGQEGAERCLCEPGFLYQTPLGGDCNDANGTVWPDATELCDGLDNDCDGTTDEGCDDDQDGFCDAAVTMVGLPPVCPLGGGDCDDLRPDVNPGALEACNNKDDNCGGGIDEGCDDDQDGYCDANLDYELSSKCPNGAGDCDDQNKNVHPGETERCSTPADDDCSGTPNDEGAIGCIAWHLDFDGDGSGSGPNRCQCYGEGMYTAKSPGDCDDANAAVHPDATERCTTPGDDNCDGLLDAEGALGCVEFFFDNDTDGWGTGNPKCTCKPGGKYTADAGGDCNDNDMTVHPGMQEVCFNGKDDNCSGSDNGVDAIGCKPFYFDFDGDGWGTGDSQCMCAAEGSFTATKVTDCNDADGAISPGALEVCATPFDDNCDGDLNSDGGTGCKTFYLDMDGDGWGTTQSSCLCVPTGSYTALQTGDCNDSDGNTFPGAVEACDNRDNNCAGGIDEGCDKDGDGTCDATRPFDAAFVSVCPGGGGDCNDLNPTIGPFADERCNGVDDDCVGGVDEGCDDDGDGWCDATMAVAGNPPSCLKGAGDCADLDPAVNPGAAEVCGNGKDDDCSGVVDDATGAGSTTYYRDADGDGWGLAFDSETLCGSSHPYTATQAGDCNDGNPQVNPGSAETCNSLDDDCNGATDDGSADAECGSAINGEMVCLFGSCVVDACDAGWADQDEEPANGCECKALSAGGAACGGASQTIQPVTFSDVDQVTASVVGNIAPEGDSDWFRFEARDDGGPGCDNFHVSIQLTGPQGVAFEIFRSGCKNSDLDCSSGRTYDFDVDAECPCTDDPNSTSPTTHLCSDNSAWMYIRVFQLPGAPKTCATYTLTVTNGD